MDKEEILKTIKEIIEIVEQLPEQYRAESFKSLLYGLVVKKAGASTEVAEKVVEVPASKTKFTLSIDVRAFLQQFSVPEEKLQKLFFMEGAAVKPTFSIETTVKAKAQMQVATLSALENALKGGKFEFSMEYVRERCQELQCYDSPNFPTHFKNNSGLFKDFSDKEHVELSPDGKAELAEAILEIAK